MKERSLQMFGVLLLCVALLIPTTVLAQAGENPLLGEAWESRAAGLVVRPPAGSRQITRASQPDELVSFVDEGRRLRMVVSRLRFSQPMALSTRQVEGKEMLGLLQLNAQQALQRYAKAVVMRSDVVNLEEYSTGMLAVRFSAGEEPMLLQQALVRASDTLYYVIEMTSPGAPAETPLDKAHPAEVASVELFAAVCDSLRLLDQGKLRDDQEQRLFRTRALLVESDEQKINQVLMPKQYLRLVRNGKDIGYSYVLEEPAERAGRKGFRVAARTMTSFEEQMTVVETVMFVSYDRAAEQWTSRARVMLDGQSREISEWGTSARRVEKVAEGNDVRTRETYFLEVSRISDEIGSEPVTRDLPVFYLPLAMGHIMPRLVGTEEKTYLFAGWVGDQQEVMARYADDLGVREVSLGGKKQMARVVSDRIGLEGQPTYHYLSESGEAAGRYLGSATPAAGLEVIASDEATLKRIWPKVDFSEPAEPEKVRVKRGGRNPNRLLTPPSSPPSSPPSGPPGSPSPAPAPQR